MIDARYHGVEDPAVVVADLDADRHLGVAQIDARAGYGGEEGAAQLRRELARAECMRAAAAHAHAKRAAGAQARAGERNHPALELVELARVARREGDEAVQLRQLLEGVYRGVHDEAPGRLAQ